MKKEIWQFKRSTTKGATKFWEKWVIIIPLPNVLDGFHLGWGLEGQNNRMYATLR